MKITKKAKIANFEYDHSNIRTIWEAYSNPSYAKEKAYCAIRNEMDELGGHGFKITAAGCQFFSCAYVLGDKLIYHTYANRYEYPRIVEA